MRSDPDQPRLTVREQLDFMRIIDRETEPTARRLLDYWATPDNHGPHAERILDATLKALWRT